MNKERGIDPILEKFSSDSESDRFISNSLKELYISGKYGTAILEGTTNPDEDRVIRAVRMVGKTDKILTSAIIKVTDKYTTEEIFEKMRQAINFMPFDFTDFIYTEPEAMYALDQEGLSTVAGVILSDSYRTGKNITEIAYPKPWMKLSLAGLFPVLPGRERERALLQSIYFLRKIPFGRVHITN